MNQPALKYMAVSRWRDQLWEEKRREEKRTEQNRTEQNRTEQSSWVVMPCNSERGTCYPHLQGPRVSQARNQQLPPKRLVLSELKFIVTAVRTSNPAKWKLGNSLLWQWRIFGLNAGKKNQLKIVNSWKNRYPKVGFTCQGDISLLRISTCLNM
jgi:hypothetical protein